ncbi:MAG TPA: DUF1302 family protein [Oligoflexus sp.]|uniref:DUF1302 family protein n=1 Tax=Oligoflexus sp. TaxID=1971216 RepID=UPI002D6EB230|nr:DUF1302 family protein [Oligoflexus sp.]HYX33800.1 DUF1302 family protein [Oligoflexus sp.]
MMGFSQLVRWKRSKGRAGWIGLLPLLMPSILEGASLESLREALNPSLTLRLAAFEESKDIRDEAPVYPASLWLKLEPEPILETSFYLEGLALHPGGEGEFQSEIREAYLERSLGMLDLKLGRQITVWGRADKLNPTDQLSSRDVRRLSSDDEDQRQGIGAAQLTYNLGDYRLIGLWQYEWRRPLYPILQDDPGMVLEQEDPRNPAAQYALKLDHAAGSVDWSLSWFEGFNRTPDIRWDGFDSGTLHLALVHQMIRVLGLDFAFNAAGIGWRGEFAHTRTGDPDGENLLVQNNSNYGVFGGDRNLIENLNVNLQAFVTQVAKDSRSEPSLPLTEAVAAQLRTNSQQRHSYQDGLSMRVNYKALQETLEWEAVGVWNRQDHDSLFRPKVTYAWNDQLKSSLGAEIYQGRPETFFGSMEELSGGFVELRYGF